jgi:hypothetical protein
MGDVLSQPPQINHLAILNTGRLIYQGYGWTSNQKACLKQYIREQKKKGECTKNT